MRASFEHEVLVELFRKCGPLAPERLRACTSTILEHDHVEVTSIDLSRIELGHLGFGLAPIVIEFRDVPRSIDPVQAHKLPELAVLSAIAHPALDTAATAFSAIEPLPADQKKLYCDVIRAKLPVALRQILEASMIKGYEYQSEFARLYYGEGHEKGLSQGREEGLSQGRGSRRSVASMASAPDRPSQSRSPTPPPRRSTTARS